MKLHNLGLLLAYHLKGIEQSTREGAGNETE